MEWPTWNWPHEMLQTSKTSMQWIRIEWKIRWDSPRFSSVRSPHWYVTPFEWFYLIDIEFSEPSSILRLVAERIPPLAAPSRPPLPLPAPTEDLLIRQHRRIWATRTTITIKWLSASIWFRFCYFVSAPRSSGSSRAILRLHSRWNLRALSQHFQSTCSTRDKNPGYRQTEENLFNRAGSKSGRGSSQDPQRRTAAMK